MRHEEQVTQIRKMLARIDAGTNVDAGAVRRNPTRVYTDPELAEREWQAFFRGHPQLIGLSGELPKPGSFLTLDDFGVPILATRDREGRFRAFVNACRHRGAILEDAARGDKRTFSCRFHAWSYASDGRLVSVPKQDHFGAIDKGCHGLTPLPAAEWNGLLFVQPDPQAGELDVEALLGPELAAELESWRFGDLHHLDGDDYDVRCNWKLAIDTFGETYHFNTLHKDTLSQGFIGNVQCYDTYGRHHRMLLCKRDILEMREKPEEEWDITIATLPVYYLFPNVQLMPFQQGCYLVRVYPVPGEPGRHVSRITFHLRPGRSEADALPPDAEVHRTMAQTFAEVIRDEDYVMSASQQRAAETGALPYAIFGRNEPALHHYHSTYRDALGMKPLPLLAPEEVGETG